MQDPVKQLETMRTLIWAIEMLGGMHKRKDCAGLLTLQGNARQLARSNSNAASLALKEENARRENKPNQTTARATIIR